MSSARSLVSRHVLTATLTCLVVALGARLVYLTAALFLDAGGVRPRHLQMTAVWLVVGGVVRGLLSRSDREEPRERLAARANVLWLSFTMLSLVLFWPALSVGFLSDDLGLLHRAERWDIGLVNDGFLRPLPMAIWALLSKAHVGAPGLHLLNILLHGTNAYLVTAVAGQWLERRWLQVLAGGFVLVSPLSAEAVVWCSGVFDVMSTTIVLATLLVAGRHRETGGVRYRIGVIALSMAAFATKESAIVLPALLLVHVWGTGASRPFAPKFDWVIGCVLALGYSIFRIAVAFEAGAPPAFGPREAQRAIFSAFGAFAAPWRVAELDGLALPWIMALLVIVLVTYGLSVWTVRERRAPMCGVLWVLIAIVPVAPFLSVGPDLEGARYVYLASVGWAALVCGFVEVASKRPAALTGAVLLVSVLAASYVPGLRWHIASWTKASEMRDVVLHAAQTNDAMRRCSSVSLTGVPGSMGGAEFLRNSLVETFAEVGLQLTPAAPAECSFTWDAELGAFRRSD